MNNWNILKNQEGKHFDFYYQKCKSGKLNCDICHKKMELEDKFGNIGGMADLFGHEECIKKENERIMRYVGSLNKND